LQGVAEHYADVEYIAPEEFTRDRIQHADAIFVRTRTRVNEDLLAGTSVRFVATATIGFDHIDTAWCDSHSVCWTACPGCNSQAVCDYVEEVLNTLQRLDIHASAIGIAGLGHVGGKVRTMAERRGLQVLVSDPPKGLFDDLTQADIITFHTPLTRGGQYPTCHLCDAAFLARCKPNALIINAARGGVVDEAALLEAGNRCVIDCWENEPDINTQLLLSPQTLLASCHIAGYSLEGKLNATWMCLDAMCKFFSLKTLPSKDFILSLHAKTEKGDSSDGWLTRLTEAMKNRPQDFEILRKQYKFR
jgi:erythronate-4-phosphate dehydrogenase